MARPKNCGRCNKPKRPKGNRFKGLSGYCECGRPTKMTPNTIQKLEDAFTNAMSDEQACAYAEISKTALYNYQKENPKFVDRKEQLKLRPDIAAKRTVVSNLGDTNNAWRWLERRDPEFRPVTKIEHAGGMEISQGESRQMSEEEKAALRVLQDARRKRIEAAAKATEQTNDNQNEKLLEAGDPTKG